MTGSEAFEILGVASTATPEEIKKAFRQKARKLHPDVNKEANAEEQFKNLNEAYSVANNPGDTFEEMFSRQGASNFYNVEDVFRQFFDSPEEDGEQRVRFWSNTSTNRTVFVTLTLEEAATGCTKEVSLPSTNCPACKGKGQVLKEQQCRRCSGSGTHGQTRCMACSGGGKILYQSRCGSCIHQKGQKTSVTFPPNITDGWRMQINGSMVAVKLRPHSEFKTDGVNIFSSCELSLLDALKGGPRKVNTVYGEKTMRIPPGRHHGDEIVAPGLGLSNQGKHVFKVTINYPEDLSKVIEVLEVLEAQEMQETPEEKE